MEALLDQVEVVVIQGRRYRRNPNSVAVTSLHRGAASAFKSPASAVPVPSATILAPSPYSEESEADYRIQEEAEKSQADLIESADGVTVTLSLFVPKPLHSYLIGKGGRTKSTFEMSTSTNLIIPASSSSDEFVSIRGVKKPVLNAKSRLEGLVQTARETFDYTHFLNIPLGTLPSIVSKAEAAYKDITDAMETEQSDGFSPELFIKPSKLHLTLQMLKLFSEKEEKEAVRVMKEVMASNPVEITREDMLHLRSIDIMNDDYTEVHVLFLKVADDSSLKPKILKLTTALQQALVKAGLLNPKDVTQQPIKLHVTLMNTKHRTLSAAQGAVIEDNGGDDGDDGGDDPSMFRRDQWKKGKSGGKGKGKDDQKDELVEEVSEEAAAARGAVKRTVWKQPFDASALFESHALKSMDWNRIAASDLEIHLSKRFVKQTGSSSGANYFHCVSSLKLIK